MEFRIAIYVQHLLGAGHLVRAMSLAESLSESGHQVLLLSGGFPIDRPVKGYSFYQLPATRAIEGDFTRLVDADNEPINDRWRNVRAARLLGEVERFDPNLVITETFPFGRRQFRFELEPLINWVQSKASVHLMSSIRDVLQHRTDAKNRLTVETIQQYYDAVLVHADSDLFKLDASFPLSHEIEDKLIYTGYIHQPEKNMTPPVGRVRDSVSQQAGERIKQNQRLSATNEGDDYVDGHDEVIVSGGSGTVSEKLLEIAQMARPLSSASKRTWRLLAGRAASVPVTNPQPGVYIEPNRSDFFALLSRCAVSVSQAGYNTTLDVLASGACSVMVPFSGDGETEQSDRAQALERAGRVVQISEAELTPERLAGAIDRALELNPVEIKLNLKGAANSARMIVQKLNEWSH